MSALTTGQWLGLGWLAGGKLLTIALVEWLSRRAPFSDRKVYAVPARDGQTRLERRAAWLLLTDPLVLGLLIASGVLRLSPSSLGASVATFGILFVWTDLWMYWNHRAMHHWKWLWRIHAHHHRSRVTQPTSAISFSLGEKLLFYTLGWLLPLAAWSQVAPVSFAGIVAFYSFYFVTSPLAHANFELASHPLHWPMKALGTATGHALHHGRVTGNYGFLTSVHDRLFGTHWADGDAIHDRVIAGSALGSLREGTHV
jgi:sterol desaturase/sphingolipid hydroxylase (fatty acid hydroxylase superfamily)